jgi:protein gp37
MGGPRKCTAERLCQNCDGSGIVTRPKRIFVNSMSDLFHEALPDEAIAAVFGVMDAAPRHTFQVLTKRPARMRDWFSWIAERPSGLLSLPCSPQLVCAGFAQKESRRHWTVPTPMGWPLRNVWLGASCEDQQRADERIPLLLQTRAAVRFVSLEPLLGPIDLERVLWGAVGDSTGYFDRDGRERSRWIGGQQMTPRPRNWLHWVIVGGESGAGARPCNIEWIRSIVRQCKDAGVPCFVKQDSGPRPGRQGRIPDDLWIKEFPDARS